MIPTQNDWNVVIVGAWNPGIFTPAWLGANLFSNPEIQIEFALTPGVPTRITGDGVIVVAAADRVTLAPKETTVEALGKAERLAQKLLELLPHTPIRAVGVNFGYLESEPGAELLERFEDPDTNALSDLGATLAERAVVRTVELSGAVINFTVSRKATELRFAFNYHSDAGTAEEARQALDGKVAEREAINRRLLSALYGLDLED